MTIRAGATRRPASALALLPALLPALLLATMPSPCGAQAADGKPPSTFGPVIGSALLCREHLENGYFYSYMKTAFGVPYKHEGGAYWFRTPEGTTLWGAPVTEVMVSDDTSELVFVAAVAEVPPDQLEQSIRSAAGVRYLAADASTYPLRVSNAGSKIAYYNTKSKIYCAKFKPLPPRP